MTRATPRRATRRTRRDESAPDSPILATLHHERWTDGWVELWRIVDITGFSSAAVRTRLLRLEQLGAVERKRRGRHTAWRIKRTG